MSRFDDMVAADNPQFLSEFGDEIEYTPAGGSAKNIDAILVDAKPRLVTANSATEEFYQAEIKISSRNNTEGHVSPTIWGFRGQAGDKVTNGLFIGFATTWYVVDRIEDGDPSMHLLLLRSKNFPVVKG